MNGIADTGFLVAFLNRQDAHHAWARSLAETVDAPLLTVEAVLAETAFHVRSVALTWELIRSGLVCLQFSAAEHLTRIESLAKRFADQSPDLADLCLICLSETHPELPVLTTDGDFHIYRRRQRERIPTLMPPPA